MNPCFQTGGPDWLFSLVLGNGSAALLVAVLAFASQSPTGSAPPWRLQPGRHLIVLAVGLGVSLASGLTVLHLVALFAPVLLVIGVLRTVDRPVEAPVMRGSGLGQPWASLVLSG